MKLWHIDMKYASVVSDLNFSCNEYEQILASETVMGSNASKTYMSL